MVNYRTLTIRLCAAPIPLSLPNGFAWRSRWRCSEPSGDLGQHLGQTLSVPLSHPSLSLDGRSQTVDSGHDGGLITGRLTTRRGFPEPSLEDRQRVL